MNFTALILTLLYVICAIACYGLEFAYWQREYPLVAEYDYKKDCLRAVYCSLVWPIALIVMRICCSFKHGFKFK